jgi:predicted secreted protein
MELPMRWLTALLCFLIFASPSSFAREQSDAPDIEIIGFSSDGRYFAYEQYGFDIAAGALDAAVFVIDRTTDKEAKGFPFGFISTEVDDKGDPVRVGGHDIDLKKLKTEDDVPDLARIRKLVRSKAAGKLKALHIDAQGRRLAGVPMTQRSPIDDKTTPLKFVLWPTIPSAIPDQQLVYTISVTVKDTIADCVNAAPPKRDLRVTFAITAERTWPETTTVAKKDHIYQMAMAKEDCPAGIWISDIIAPPDAKPEKPMLMVVFLSQTWSSAVDGAQYRATFIEMPDGD